MLLALLSSQAARIGAAFLLIGLVHEPQQA